MTFPDKEILRSFGLNGETHLLDGGQGTSYRVDNVVLKPVEDEAIALWSAELLSNIETDGFRVARPVPTIDGSWLHHGWQAFTFVEGAEEKGRVGEKIETSRLFHRALAAFPQPSCINEATHPWAIADRMTWGEIPLVYGARLQNVIARLKAMLQPVTLESQLIHGDMTGNILFHQTLLPAVIDISPYWRPAQYATAIIMVDSVVWDGAPLALTESILDEPEMHQLLVRAVLWRAKTTEEFIQAYGHGSLDDIDAYLPLITLLEKKSTVHTTWT